MSFKRCPGSMAFSQPKIELVRCPYCGNDAEVWSDEADGTCANCGLTVCRTATQSCIDWCKYSRECLGDEEFKRYQNLKTRLRKDALLKAVEARLSDPEKLVFTKLIVMQAEQLLSKEPAADPNVVLAAAALVTGCAGQGGGADDTEATADTVLHALGYPEGFIKEVCAILRQLWHLEGGDSINFRVVCEADRLARRRA
jgi:hypothetical protein